MLQEQIMEEIKQIPNNKLVEIYDLIHYFRVGLTQDNKNHKVAFKKRPIGLLKGKLKIPTSFFEPLPDELIDSFEGK